MSQPPYSSSASGYGYPPAQAHPLAMAAHALDTLLVPARRASVLMFIYAALGTVFGGCFLLAAVTVTSDQMMQQQPQVQQMVSEMGLTVEQLQVLFGVAGVIVLVGSMALGVMAVFVRRGTVGWLVGGLLLTAGPMALLLLFMGVGLLMGEPMAVCVYGLPVAMLAVVTTFLVQALARCGLVGQWQAYERAMTSQSYAAPAASPLGYAPPPPTTNTPGPQSPSSGGSV